MEVGVVGAGIVGLAVARALTRAADGVHVTVLEKESEVGRHQTGHNSGVVHAGLYYAPGSLKAQLCGRGRAMLREYCADKGIAFDECGKVVVAASADEVPALREIERRATANGVPGLRWVPAGGLREIEPHVRGAAGLYSPHTAVVDFRAVARAYADDVRAAGGQVLLDTRVTAIRRVRGRIHVMAAGQVRRFDRLVICAGLQSDRLATAAGYDADPRIVPFLGMYYQLSDSARGLVRGLIYPVPDPRLPFLGVHLTRTVHGDVLVGPNAVPGLAREAYRVGGVRPADVAATLAWPGFYRLAARYWRSGAAEVAGAVSKRRFVAAARRYVPELAAGDLVRAPLGVRAQSVARDGSMVDDFAIDAGRGIVALRNAPSPAATSSLAIADHVLPLILP